MNLSDEQKDRLKEEYYQHTGEDLPDHVVENLDLLGAKAMAKPEQIQRQVARRREQTMSTDRVNQGLSLMFILGVIAISGVVSGYLSSQVGGAWLIVGTFLFVGLSSSTVMAMAVISEWQDS